VHQQNCKKEEKQMKSKVTSIIGLAKREILTAFLSIAMVAIISPVASANSSTWSLDSDTSSASLFQGSRANPDSVNTGVARVTGEVSLDPNDLDNSVVDLNIFPEDEDWEHTLNLEGNLPKGFVPDATEHTLLTFRSKHIIRTKDGKVEAIGDLTLTRVDRSVTATPNEAYAGPVYGDPVIHTETREVTFLFPGLGNALVFGPLTPVALQKYGPLEVSGSASVVRENFPALLSAVRDTNWPTVVQNEDCQMPSTIGEDYQGPTCTGTVIAATHNDNCQISASAGGEGYSGPVCTPPAGDQTTIVLNLQLHQTGSEPSTETFPAVGGSL
jgi:polyisoprenoid-binding protein YceI